MKAVNGRRARGTQSNGRSSRLDKGRFKRRTGVELAKDQQSRTGVALETSNWTGIELEVHGKHRNLFAIEVPAFISPGVTNFNLHRPSCRRHSLISFNVVFGLTYFDLVVDELSTS